MIAAERYATAVSVGIPDRDAILAGAMAKGWGTSLFRLKYANDAKEYFLVCRMFKDMATKVARRNSWRDDVGVRKLARQVLDYWLADICPTCLGKGFEVTPDTPVLSDVPCKQCGGTGKRAWKAQGEWHERGDLLLGYIQLAESAAAKSIMSRLRKEMDL